MRFFRAIICLLFAVLVLTPIASVAAQRDEDLRGMAIALRARTEQLTTDSQESLRDLQAILPRLKKARVDNSARQATSATLTDSRTQRIAFSSTEAKNAAVQEVESRIAALKQLLSDLNNRTDYYYGFLNPPLETGNFGRLYPGSAIVKKLIGPSSVLVEYSGVPADSPVKEPGLGGSMFVIVSNIPTQGVVLDQALESKLVFEVSGTRTFEVKNSGSETVFVLEPLNTKAIEAIARTLK